MADTNTAVPAAPAPATPAPQSNMTATQPAQPPKTPPLPKAQDASLPPSVKNPKPTAPQKLPTGNSLEANLRKLSSEMLDKPPAEAAPEPAKAPETPTPSPDTPPAPKTAEKPKETPPPVAEKGPFDAMELPSDASEAQKTNFRKMKETAAAEVNRLKNEQATLAKELETYKKATPADLTEAARLREELKVVQDRLAVHDLSAHPDFQRQYTEPKKKALALSEELANDYQVPNAAELKNLLDLPRPEFAKRLSEMGKDMPAFDQTKFFTSMDEARRLQMDERGALSKATELRANLQAKAAQEARNAFTESAKDFAQKVPELSVPEGADEEMVQDIRGFNAARLQAMQEAEHATFGQMNERQVADAMIQAANLKVVTGHLLPNLMKQRAKLEKLVADQHAELTAIKGKKNPGSFTGSQPVAEAPPKSLRELTARMLEPLEKL